ncbi:50S ribosomal protein L27 [Candidatus Vidania fulgoroideorum]
MAKKKAAGALKNGRDSKSKKLGIKIFGGEKIKPGQIILRQRGTKYKSKSNTKIGRDHTIFSLVKGKVYFKNKFVFAIDYKDNL